MVLTQCAVAHAATESNACASKHWSAVFFGFVEVIEGNPKSLGLPVKFSCTDEPDSVGGEDAEFKRNTNDI